MCFAKVQILKAQMSEEFLLWALSNKVKALSYVVQNKIYKIISKLKAEIDFEILILHKKVYLQFLRLQQH